MKIAMAQLNYTVGDMDGNAAKIADAAERARSGGASLLLTTELSICGYSPEDLLLRNDFCDACAMALAELARKTVGITLVVGHPQRLNGKRYNAASVLRDGKIIATYHKRELPNYKEFDEKRYFDSDTAPCVFEHEGVRFWPEHLRGRVGTARRHGGQAGRRANVIGAQCLAVSHGQAADAL